MINSLKFSNRLFLIVFLALLQLLYAPSTNATDASPTANPVEFVLCNVIRFVKNLGLPIMTGVIIGSSVLAIFGRLAWPAIVMLVVFTAIFFGAGKVVERFVDGGVATGTVTCPN